MTIISNLQPVLYATALRNGQLLECEAQSGNAYHDAIATIDQIDFDQLGALLAILDPLSRQTLIAELIELGQQRVEEKTASNEIDSIAPDCMTDARLQAVIGEELLIKLSQSTH